MRRLHDDARGRYIEFCKSTFPNELDLRGLKIVVDAYGAAYHIAPDVFHELGAEVISIGVQPNGFWNINAGRWRDSTGAGAGCTGTRCRSGDCPDGDADRIQMVDAAGRLYDGDQLLRHRQASGAKRQSGLGTLINQSGLEHALAKLDIPFARAAVMTVGGGNAAERRLALWW